MEKNVRKKRRKEKENRKSQLQLVWWLKPIISATWEVESEKITIQGHAWAKC
jgi:hypothetical protein